MRDIKFRAWDKAKKQFIHFDLSDIYDIPEGGGHYHPGIDALDGEIGHFDILDASTRQEHFIFQQFTGLKDDKGVEIFDGDILYKYGDNYNGVIEWAKEDEWIEGTGWFIHEYYPKRGKFKEPDRYHTTSAYSSPKIVIGNIFENPELKHTWGD